MEGGHKGGDNQEHDSGATTQGEVIDIENYNKNINKIVPITVEIDSNDDGEEEKQIMKEGETASEGMEEDMRKEEGGKEQREGYEPTSDDTSGGEEKEVDETNTEIELDHGEGIEGEEDLS